MSHPSLGYASVRSLPSLGQVDVIAATRQTEWRRQAAQDALAYSLQAVSGNTRAIYIVCDGCVIWLELISTVGVHHGLFSALWPRISCGHCGYMWPVPWRPGWCRQIGYIVSSVVWKLRFWASNFLIFSGESPDPMLWPCPQFDTGGSAPTKLR